ncbi:1-phosphofructokinase family hexose kinase [Plantibacter sp. VKM Ac-2880]|uniref:1-phosphofructokinase family hexose kinase n=1 Tax=Plantibacter sp. VKM Ac-2880 TaxID=2783827 RepID=UPI00188F69B9|nr:PfkB family carbohydrate kinase [Plantibacter sp. VKM Ac-2880]MBF4569939.1 1-phosphofructokinase family hexose kinase [Plantibacter sp. VKM Ac-2880]
MSGIVTVTPAAAIDQTYRVDGLRLGDVNRAVGVSTELSGKGVNVARAVTLSRLPVRAVVPMGEDGRILAGDPALQPLLAVVPTDGRTRVNTTILDDATGTTKVNEPAIPLRAADWAAVVAASAREIDRIGADWLVLSGTIPTVTEGGGLVDILELLREAGGRGARVAVDTAGVALETAVANLDLVHLLKPNAHELAELTGRELLTIGDVAAAADELHRAGCDLVYVSMGADGALVRSSAGLWHAHTAATVVNTAGAGDASLAGFLVGLRGPDGQDDPAAAVATAAAWGALAVSSATTVLTSLDGAPLPIAVRDPDPGTPLREPATPPRSEVEPR